MMNKYEVAQKILNLLDCDYDEIVDAIYKLADEVEKEFEEEDDDYAEDVAQDVFIEPLYLTMTNEEVNEVIDRCRRRVVEESGSTDL